MEGLPESALVLPSMTKLDSSNIHSIGYASHSPDVTYFYVRFTTQRVYLYEMTVDEASMHYGLMRGPHISAGKYFNQNIKDNYPNKEITNLIRSVAFNWSEVFNPNSPIGRRCGLGLHVDENDFL